MTLPKDTLAEILLYLAEKEKFPSLKDLGSISSEQVRRSLRDLAHQLKTEAKGQTSQEAVRDLEKTLKKSHQDIVRQLNPDERERLLKSFLN